MLRGGFRAAPDLGKMRIRIYAWGLLVIKEGGWGGLRRIFCFSEINVADCYARDIITDHHEIPATEAAI